MNTYNGKGSHVDMEMYRSMLFVDVIGKVSARAHRLAVIGALANYFSGEYSWQCGGVPGLRTDFLVFAIRFTSRRSPSRRHVNRIHVCGREAGVLRDHSEICITCKCRGNGPCSFKFFRTIRYSHSCDGRIKSHLAKRPSDGGQYYFRIDRETLVPLSLPAILR